MCHKLTKNVPEADFAFREAMQSSLVAEYKPLEAASMLLCASFHSCSAPNTRTVWLWIPQYETKIAYNAKNSSNNKN